MNKLIITAALIALATAAQLPSATYLPQGTGGETYLPPAPGAPGSNNQYGSNGQNSGNARPQQDAEKSSAILRADQEITDNGFHYAYETSNGIQGEESGDIAQTRGAFAYKGDDGQIYSITFTAGEDGFRPQGAHLPVPPPTPDEILEALKQNERDEAAGIFDDGQYHPENNGQEQGSSGQGYGTNGPQSSSSGYSY